jgi:hypothetical protein
MPLGTDGTVRAQPEGLTLPAASTWGPTSTIALRTIAKTAHDAEQDGAPHPANDQGDGQQQAEAEHHRRPADQAVADAQLHRDGGVGGVGDAAHEAGVDEADEGDEQADADADGLLEGERDGVHHPLAQAGQDQRGDDQALQHHDAHGRRPGHHGGQLEGDHGVQPEPGRDRERVAAVHAHEQRHDRRHQRGRGGERPEGQAPAGDVLGAAEDQRVEDDDVGHGEEGGEAAADLPLHGGAALGDVEVGVQSGAGRRASRVGPNVRLGGHR